MGWLAEEDGVALLAEDNGPFVARGQEQARIQISRVDESTNFELNEETSISTSGQRERLFRHVGTVIGPNYPPTGGNTLDDVAGEGLSSPFICAYSVNRGGWRSQPARAYRAFDSVQNLFKYDLGLTDPELALRRLKDFKEYNTIEKRLKKALDLTDQDRFVFPQGGGVHISGPTLGQNVPLQAWADGYRLTFTWFLDLYAWAMQADALNEVGDIQGILLIDEIEQHLHPAMQTGIFNRISELLPCMQIIATTHSPLTALGCLPGELVLLRQKGQTVEAVTDLPDFHGFSVEDLLTHHDFFDTEPYHPEIMRKLERYRKLTSVERNQRTPDQVEELSNLAADLRASQYIKVEDEVVLKELRSLKKMLATK